MSKGDGAPDWGALVSLIVHPTKAQMIEVMLWIGLPVAAADLEEIFAGTASPLAISYHARSLGGTAGRSIKE